MAHWAPKAGLVFLAAAVLAWLVAFFGIETPDGVPLLPFTVPSFPVVVAAILLTIAAGICFVMWGVLGRPVGQR